MSVNRTLGKDVLPSGATRRSELFASAIYLTAFMALILCARLRFGLFFIYWVGGPYELAMLAGAGLLASAAILHFMGRRFADALALLGTIFAWPCFRLLEFSGHEFSAWLVFNYPGLHAGVNGEAHAAISVLDVQVSVLAAISLLIFSLVCSALRLASRSWMLRGFSLRDRIWPVVAIWLCLVAAWFVESVTPYRIPVYDRDDLASAVLVLHAEKHGFRIEETRVAIYRDGRAFVTHDRRHLFQYSFPMTIAEIYLTPSDDRLVQNIIHFPPQLQGTFVSAYTPPRSWDADRWFVSLRTNPKLIEVSEPDLPAGIAALYRSVPTTPPHESYAITARDICFGFCYDPDK
ncbi:MAG TPA: hypothetical protein VMB47_16005 [Candidatus Aquilonibacter sp.]|nr:hypothetical protein [Candidatus Aquilonibacter sp.]